MSKKDYKKFMGQCLGVIAICSAVMLSILPVSCKLTEEGIEIIETDAECPQIQAFGILNRNCLEFVCTKEMLLSDLVVTDLEDSVVCPVQVHYREDKKSADLILDQSTEIGKNYNLTGTVTASNGNTLSFKLPFSGYNDHPAKLMFSEFRTDYSKKNDKTELIELIVTESGNTSGLVIESGYYGSKFNYAFPAIEVEKGECIVVHYRTLYEDLNVDELGDDVLLSDKCESSDARDLWIKGNEKLLGKNDVLAVVDKNRDVVIDGILLSESTKIKWSNEKMESLAQKLFEQGLWKENPDVESAICTDKMTYAHTMARQSFELPGCKEQWMFTDSTTMSVGMRNTAEPAL